MSKTADELIHFAQILRDAADNYAHKHFPPLYNDLINSFCHVVPNIFGLKDFFRLAVSTVYAVSRKFYGAIYVYNKETRKLELMCNTENGILDPPVEIENFITDGYQELEMDNKIIYPLLSRSVHEGEVPEMPWDCDYQLYTSSCCAKLNNDEPFIPPLLLEGYFTVGPADSMYHEDRLFFPTLTKWIGTELDKRLTAFRNLQHICFLNSLGKDIGHDIIIPNMRFTWLLKMLNKHLVRLSDMEKALDEAVGSNAGPERINEIRDKLSLIREDLEACNKELQKQHIQISTFIENVFREEHFSKGRFVPRIVKSFVEQDVIIPQLEIYETRLKEKGINVERPSNMYEQEYPLLVDIGLLSQVYANLFSNAVKYTGEITDRYGRRRKVMAYGCEEVPDFHGDGQNGLKFNVFTTGKPLSKEECKSIFFEGRRGEHAGNTGGSGHGLAFIRRIIEVHGGECGCEPTEEGNNFYFILPVHKIIGDK